MRVVIGEDSALFREGLSRLLADAGHEVVAAVDRADLLDEAVERGRPDVVVLDIRMPPDLSDDGARAARRLRTSYPDLGILLLSQHLETRQTIELVSRGGFGYLLKDRVLDFEDFLESLRRVAAGGSALDPEVVAHLLRPPPPQSALALLTAREYEVLSLMAEGRNNLGIAHRLHVSERTVEAHVASILTKLDLRTSAEDHRRVLAALVFLEASAT
jgi:DNA-binding NarL/FixJ family response regulator